MKYTFITIEVFLLDQVFQLLEAFRHEEQFQWKSKLLRILVKLGEKRVVRKLLQHKPGIVVF